MSTIEAVEFKYQVGARDHSGYFAYDAEHGASRPGIIVVHEWWGVNDYIKDRARQLAVLGYAALAIDLYGDGITADNPEQASSLMNEVLQNMDAGTARLRAGYESLLEQSQVDATRTAAIGYCFGGAMALHMARIGMPLKAAVSFHGALGSFHNPVPGEVIPRVLVCHGGDDAMVSNDDVEAFRAEFDAAKANYEVVVYPHALHGFSNPLATERGKKHGLPLAYNADADGASWQAMRDLFNQVFE